MSEASSIDPRGGPSRRRVLCLCCVGTIVGLVPVRVSAAVEAVAAADEPHHHVIFENADLRIMRVLIPPGQTTDWHRHNHDFVVTTLRGARTRSEQEGEATAVVSEIPTDSVRFMPYADKPVVHRTANESGWLNHQLAFEILRSKPGGFGPADRKAVPQFEPILENAQLRAWRLRLVPGAYTPAITQNGPGVRVILSGDRVIDRFKTGAPVETDVRAGDAAFLSPDSRAVTNAGGGPLDLIEFELL